MRGWRSGNVHALSLLQTDPERVIYQIWLLKCAVVICRVDNVLVVFRPSSSINLALQTAPRLSSPVFSCHRG